MKRKLFIVMSVLPILHNFCLAQVITWVGHGNISISSNQVAQIVSMKLDHSASYGLTIGNGSNICYLTGRDFFFSGNTDAGTGATIPGANWPWPITVAGPGTITLSSNPNNPTDGSFATLKVSDKAPEIIPSTSVVIPTESTGPVSIVLESSADLVNWSAALPGTYGANTTNRFFRVRAVRQ